MRNHRVAIWLSILCIGAFLLPFASCQEEKPQQTTVCELLAHPEAWNHKLVQITGFASHGFEDSSFFDPECVGSRYRFWMEYGGLRATGTMSTVSGLNQTRPSQASVEGIEIPLIEDAQFRRFDGLLHRPGPGNLVHATVLFRFFAGSLQRFRSERWGGFGHLGCCSMLVAQQVLSVDDRSVEGFDTSDEPDQPWKAAKCFKRLGRMDNDLLKQLRASQNSADGGDDPKRVAIHALRDDFARMNFGIAARLDESHYKLKLTKDEAARKVYGVQVSGVKGHYVVVVSRPYLLSFYVEEPKMVPWVSIAEWDVGCSTPDGKS